MMCTMNRAQRRAWGPLIREARVELGMDQAELADAAGTSRRTVGSIERGDTVGQPAVIDRMLKVLGLRPADDEVEASDSAEVDALVAVIRPLLLRMSDNQRAGVTPKMIELIADALRASGPVVNMPTSLAARAIHEARRRNDEPGEPRGDAMSVADPNVVHLYDEPSAAQPHPTRDVEGDLDPEDT